MKVALKEWAVVVEALARGRQIFLLRKGGIAEGRSGFELRHREFLFFPAWEHQQQDLVQPAYREIFASLRPQDPETLPIRYFAQVTDVVNAPPHNEGFARLAAFHIWQQPHIKLRYEYRPDLPLFMVVVRMHRLPETVQLPNDRRYRGCRSWVELSEDVPIAGAQPIESDHEFAAHRTSFLAAVEEAQAATGKTSAAEQHT